MPSTFSAPFSAVLLAGGLSRRMGTDKSLLPASDGRPLWRRQVELLGMPGCAEVLISCRRDQAHFAQQADFRLVVDREEDCGPLAGLGAALEAAQEKRVLVLAVDMPFMRHEPLTILLDRSSDHCGAVFRRKDGACEPLAAVYPKSLLPAVVERLAQRQLALQDLLHDAATRGRMAVLPLPPEWTGCFENWNTPQDAGLGAC
jgi:molybdopterin-guanine dinucleotide biosynthesis protein A